MWKKITGSLFIVAVIGCLIIILPERLEANTKSQEEIANIETTENVSLLSTNEETNKVVSVLENTNYIDNETYNIIKQAYAGMEYNIHFELGDAGKYDLYKAKFLKVLNSEVTFTDEEKKQDYYLNQYGFFSVDAKLGLFDLKNYFYYFFDIDGDSTPELCIKDNARFTYVLKYDESSDYFYIWQRYETPTLILMGTKKIAISGNARTGYFLLNEHAEYEQYFWLKVDGYTDSVNNIGIFCYLVTLPQEQDQHVISEKMKAQALLDEHQNLYYFRVTEQQYNELASNLNKAIDESRNAIKEVSFTYEELFNRI